jgi:LacI family transcriptional regulator
MRQFTKSRVTQKDVAREAGVSHVTVSLALRGRRGIPPATRKRIESIAKRLGYTPDPMLKALSAYRQTKKPIAYQSTLGWINNHPQPDMLYRSEGFRLTFEGAQQRAAELGYGLEAINLSEFRFEKETAHRVLDTHGIRGLLVAPLHASMDRVDLDWDRYSAVRLGYSMKDTLLHTVVTSQYRGAYMATEQLVRLGYRRIAYIHEREFNIRTSGHFLGGYLSACAHYSLDAGLILSLPVIGTNRDTLAWEQARTWIAKEKPDAIIMAAWDILPHLIHWGFRVPEEIGLVSLTLGERNENLSGIHQNERAAGRAAIDVLTSLVERQEIGIPRVPMHILIEGVWREGHTTRNLPKSPPIRLRGHS